MSVVAKIVGAEFVVSFDGFRALETFQNQDYLSADSSCLVHSNGSIESVLDQAIENTSGDYILRLDDDESISSDMVDWLREERYLSHPHWKFPRAHLFSSINRAIVNPPLWPDYQTRLSTRTLSGQRHVIHCPSPFGGGEEAPKGCMIIHHKFIVKSLAERQLIMDRYNSISPDKGDDFKVFSVPERVIDPDEWKIAMISNIGDFI